ncbi:MAG TPA: AAA family ATPase, partial [Coxiellaceae bacterium]|nr:AAA family ATPase [Coxiellaceae bacterium]
ESHLYFWSREKRGSMAEVDFITTVDAKIIPIEVKAGTTGRLKSLHLFMNEKKSLCGIRLSQHLMSNVNNVISLPLYLTSEISRIVDFFPNLD